MRPVMFVLVGVLLLAGCAAQPAPKPTPTVEAITAEQTCKQVSNVLTVLQNAAMSRSEERSTESELDGSIALASSMLDDVDVEPSSPYEEIVGELRSYSVDEYSLFPISEGSARWGESMTELNELCTADGSELEVNVWTGG